MKSTGLGALVCALVLSDIPAASSAADRQGTFTIFMAANVDDLCVIRLDGAVKSFKALKVGETLEFGSTIACNAAMPSVAISLDPTFGRLQSATDPRSFATYRLRAAWTQVAVTTVLAPDALVQSQDVFVARPFSILPGPEGQLMLRVTVDDVARVSASGVYLDTLVVTLG